MKRIVSIILAAALLMASCTPREIGEGVLVFEVFHASIEQHADPDMAESKVYADSKLRVLWNADDRISIFNLSTYNREYRFEGQDGDNSGSFSKIDDGSFVSGNAISSVYAVYPYSKYNIISNDEVLSVTLPSTQVWKENSFGSGANVMVSAGSDSELMFKNVGGLLVLKVYGNGCVKRAELRGNAGEKLSGSALVQMPVGGEPSMSFAEAASEVVALECPTPVALGEDAEHYTELWFVLPPGKFESGFTVKLFGPGGATATQSTSKTITITRSSISRMAPFEAALDYPQPLESIAEVLDAQIGQEVLFDSYVYAAGSRAFIASDALNSILVYCDPGNMSCSVGDKVRISGTLAMYRQHPEISNPVIEVLSSGNGLSEVDYIDITDSFADFSFDFATPVKARGVFTANASNTGGTIAIEGTTRFVYVYWPDTGQFDFNGLDGKDVEIKGYYLFDLGFDERDILPVSLMEVTDTVQPDNEIWYTSTDGNIVKPTRPDAFGVNIVSNSCQEGKGVITFDGPVEMIGWDAFAYCMNLDEMCLPESVRLIGPEAFISSSLRSIVLPQSYEMSRNPFPYCQRLESFYGGYASEDNRCLILHGALISFAPSGLLSYSVPEGAISIFSHAFWGCNSLLSLDFSDTLEEIHTLAICECGLQSIYIPYNVGYIEEAAIVDCPISGFDGRYATPDGQALVFHDMLIAFAPGHELDCYVVPEGVSSIGALSFHYCGLKSVVFPQTLSYIGDEAFKDCFLLSDIVIPSGIEVLGNECFYRCEDIKTITVLAENPPQGGSNMFGDTGDCPIYVPAASVEAYKTADVWSGYADRIKPLVPLPEVVDLGLQVKWASFNLGASSPEQAGSYYAWGELYPKPAYSWKNYRFGTMTNKTKYNFFERDGVVDNLSVLELADDAAHTSLGTGWRIPTKDDWRELRENCIWTSYEVNGVPGYMVKSKSGGVSIFLPVTGYYDGSNLNKSQEIGYYWSSSLDYGDDSWSSDDAYHFYLDPDNNDYTHEAFLTRRYEGLTIRPVFD